MLTMLGGLVERDLIRARKGDGRKRAKARGVNLGRKTETNRPTRPRDDPPARPSEPVREIAGTYNVSRGMISRL
jgi:DNA invertase Pin-like site-specific DNA recombinase